MKLHYSTDGRLVTTYSVWSENDFIFSISSCFNREGGGCTEGVSLVPASLDQSGQCYLWFSTFFSSRRRGFPKIGFTGRPSAQVRQCASTSVRKYVSAQVRQCASTSVRKYVSAQVRQCASTSVRKSVNAQVRQCASTSVRMYVSAHVR